MREAVQTAKTAERKESKNELIETTQLLAEAMLEQNISDFKDFWDPLTDNQKLFVKNYRVTWKGAETCNIKLGDLATKLLLNTYNDFQNSYPEGAIMPQEVKDQMTQTAAVYGTFVEILM